MSSSITMTSAALGGAGVTVWAVVFGKIYPAFGEVKLQIHKSREGQRQLQIVCGGGAVKGLMRDAKPALGETLLTRKFFPRPSGREAQS
ncbi:MAG: hypothetical protein HY231_26255 [Acidobacteria bacterium]|nr:hypothetical protein [Acidobacteriota bacterium]